MDKHLFLYTLSFPYGKGEAFLEPEIDVLCNLFARITIIPLKAKDTIRSMPKNVETKNIFEESTVLKTGLGKKMKLLSKARADFRFLKDLRYQYSLISDLSYKTEVLSSFVKGKNAIHYSYWLDEWATILATLKSRGEIQSFVSRVHGFDLYEERARLGYKPWRNFQLDQVGKVYAVSDAGQQYLQHRYPKQKGKIGKSFLGTKDLGLGEDASEREFNILSCSSVIPLKRVPLIVDVLKGLKLRVHWTHIGGGVDLEMLRRKVEGLPENISAKLLGMQAHSDVLEYYKRNTVDCFINVSSTEGLPVSIMEAISFGVPVLATDVGGVSEIVNERTGMLIPVIDKEANFDVAVVREKIRIIAAQKNTENGLKKSARKFWEEHFSAAINYTKFAREIQEICS